MSDHKEPYLPPAEIDALRLKAFRTNNANDIAAYNRQVSLYFQHRMDRELDRSYRIEKLEAENKLLNSIVADAAIERAKELEPKDGRPCATDEFLAVILDELDDNWDIFEAIKNWVEGDWVNAVQGTTIAELKGEK
jgi:hypothetical protein